MKDENGVKTLTIISGKGGTGKTSIAACFAVLSSPVVLADCDVDAANLHLVMLPEVKERHDFFAMPIAKIREDDCTSCGICADVCRYDAIEVSNGNNPLYTVDPMACEACLVCKEFCPVNAIDTVEQLAGEWNISEARTGPMVYAHLGIAQENSGKLVTEVRKAASRIAAEHNLNRIIVDGPPGIGCAVIASLTGSDMILAVTEATQSGYSDLCRIHALAKHFNIPFRIIINKADLNAGITDEIKTWAENEGAKVVGELPYDTIVTEAMITRKAVVEYSDAPISKEINASWEKIWQEL